MMKKFIITISLTLISSLSVLADDDYATLNGSIGVGSYNKQAEYSIGLELRHQPSFSESFQYDIVGAPHIIIFKDPINGDKTNVAINYIGGFFDFAYLYFGDIRSDRSGLISALLDGRIHYKPNKHTSIFIGNYLQPIPFRDKAYWRERLEIGIELKKFKRGPCHSSPCLYYTALRVSSTMTYNLIENQKLLWGFGIEIGNYKFIDHPDS